MASKHLAFGIHFLNMGGIVHSISMVPDMARYKINRDLTAPQIPGCISAVEPYLT